MRYKARVEWTGSTAEGWESYDRSHVARVADQTVALTTGEPQGDPRLANPELLLLAAASSCQMLWFLHLAAKARIDVIRYTDKCEAEMPEDRITRIVLRPLIEIDGPPADAQVLRLCKLAHEECNIAKSVSAPVEVEPKLWFSAP